MADEPEEMDELLCVGGPCAGHRVQVRRSAHYVHVVPKISSILPPLVEEMLPSAVDAAFEMHVYERVLIADGLPSGETTRLFVLAYSQRRSSFLRELIAGYARAFERRQ